jgi:hypothetical protein
MSYPPGRVRSIMRTKTNYMKLAAANPNNFEVNTKVRKGQQIEGFGFHCRLDRI